MEETLTGEDVNKEVTRFDSNQAFVFLFAVSFGPAFIVVDLVTEDDQDLKGFYTVNSILLVFIALTFISNAISVWMLTKVQS